MCIRDRNLALIEQDRAVCSALPFFVFMYTIFSERLLIHRYVRCTMCNRCFNFSSDEDDLSLPAPSCFDVLYLINVLTSAADDVDRLCVNAKKTLLCSNTIIITVTRRPASADRTTRAANFRRDLEAT